MEEPIFDSHSRSAGMKKKAFLIEDTIRSVSSIEQSPLPGVTQADRLNQLLTDHWRSNQREYRNPEFIARFLAPLHERYGDKIMTLNQLGKPGIPWK